MHFRPCFLPFFLLVLGLAVPGRAEEKNGISVSVQKVTLDRADVRGADVNSENLDRLMGLRVTLKNSSFRELPESQITWEILKRRFADAGLELTTGTEKLQPLKGGESVDLTMGIARVAGTRNGAILRKDELDWEITIKQDNREVAKFSSKSNFAMLLKRAVKVDPPAAPTVTPPAAPAPPATAPTATPVPPKP